MKKFTKLILILMLTVGIFANCATQRIHTAENASVRAPSHEGTSHFFLYGIGQTKEINAEFICGDRPVEAVETQISFLNGLLGAITYGIYYPLSYSVYCGAKKTK